MDVTVTTVFDAPRGLVAAVAGDPSQVPRWMANIRSMSWHGEPVLAEGSTFDLVGRFLGREIVYTYRVLALVPGERVVMSTERGPFPIETTMTWWDEEPPADGPEQGQIRTGMSLRRAGRPHGMTTLGSGAATLGMKRAMRRDLEQLRLLVREEAALRGRDPED